MDEIGYKIQDENLKEIIIKKAKEEKGKRDLAEVKRETYWEKKKPIKLSQELCLFYINQMINKVMIK